MAPLLQLFVRPEALSVVRVDAEGGLPGWAFSGPGVAAVVRRDSELGVVCASECVPRDVVREDGWIALEVAGPLDFSLTGILVAVAQPLAEAGVSIYALSTYDTDVVLVRRAALEAAVAALRAAGHDVDVSRLS
jgi:uncharacterized protein